MKYLILIFLFIFGFNLYGNPTDTVKIKPSFKMLSISDILHEDKVFLYKDTSHIYIAIDPKWATVARITICNELGSCKEEIYVVDKNLGVITYMKPDFKIFLMIEIFDDILIDTLFDVYLYEIK